MIEANKNWACKVDWYSFTLLLTEDEYKMDKHSYSLSKPGSDDTRDILSKVISRELSPTMLDIAIPINAKEGFESVRSKAKYRTAFNNKKLGLTVHSGGRDTILIEFSGRGVSHLQELDVFEELVRMTYDRTTRIDIAGDILDDMRPLEFCSHGYSNNFKSHNHDVSPTGETYYIGSRNSSKMCRVYRFDKPHPRADKLRVEYEIKKKEARSAAKAYAAYGAAGVFSIMQNHFKFKCPLMNVWATDEHLVSQDNHAYENSGTINWLLTAVAPAIQRLASEGEFGEDPELWILENLLHRKLY